MTTEGPELEALTQRLAACPADFLAEPRIGQRGQVHVAAVVADLLRDLGCPPLTPAQVAVLSPRDARPHRNWLSLVLITCWLLHADWFRSRANDGAALTGLLTGTLAQLASLTQAPIFISDPDRREELARLTLSELGLRPASETPEQAADRLTTLSTIERARVVRAAQQAEERARQVREAMAKQAAEEAAAQYSRE
jgi:hypothetical protein